LIQKGEQVLICGDKNEEALGQAITGEIPQVTNMIGKTTVMEMVGLIASANCVIGVDSGIAHVSSALNIPTIVIWGPTSFVKNHQVGSKTVFVDLNMPCSPCTGIELLTEPEAFKSCPRNHLCMAEVTPDKVFSTFTALFAAV
jgi:ADP-heptose:LPS heptosyltransferase